jgi:hypothetical protein
MDLSMLQLRLLIIGLRFEKKTGMLMTSPSKANSAKIAKAFLGLPVNKKIDKGVLADMLEQAKNEAEKAIAENNHNDGVILLTGQVV